MGWQLHEPWEPTPLNVADDESVYHVVVYWPELDEPLEGEVAARDVDHARERSLEAFSRILGREPIERIDVFTLDEWVTR
jgi:hypothetical protein